MSKTLYTIASALLMLCLGCKEEGGSLPVPSQGNFTLSSRADAGDEAEANELIHDWWIILADAGGRIAASAEGDAGGVDRTTFKIDANTGTYTVYAFANISRSELAQALNLSAAAFDDGAVLPAGFDSRSIAFDATMPESDDVPMSGRIDGVAITDRTTDAFSIEVVRMWGKLDFEFSNSSADDIEVLGITFGPLQSGPVNLFPYNVPGKPTLLDGITDLNTHTYNFQSPGLVPSGGEAACTRHVYVHESISDSHPTGKFHFSVIIKRAGQMSEQLFALTEDLTWINRNDHIQIPIDFLDWSLRFECKFAPPIGGYPAVLIEVVNYEYYIKFGSSGRFTLTPLVRKGAEGDFLSPDKLDFSITSLSDPNGILDSPLKFEDGNIVGNLTDLSNPDGTPRLGTAAVEMSVRVKEAANGLDHVFNRKFYIIRAKQ